MLLTLRACPDSPAVAQIWSPYLYPSSDGPQYVKAFSVNAACTALAICLSLILRMCLKRENAKLAASEVADGRKRTRYVL